MKWKDHVLDALDKIMSGLDKNDLFYTDRHRSLFHEITNCYYDRNFFTPGMVKCMYMASWDDEHFSQLLTMLMEMSFTKGIDLHDMADNGELMAEESTMDSNTSDACIYNLSCAFIQDEPFDLSTIPADLNAHAHDVISFSLRAGNLIDQIVADYEI